MTKKILAEISIGELLDKISILEIKQKKIKEKKKLIFIRNEYKILITLKKNIKISKKIDYFYKQLKKANQTLWDIENKIRFYEKIGRFDKNFIMLARKVYKTNDKRSLFKLKINNISGSNIIEMKSYSKYT